MSNTAVFGTSLSLNSSPLYPRCVRHSYEVAITQHQQSVMTMLWSLNGLNGSGTELRPVTVPIRIRYQRPLLLALSLPIFPIADEGAGHG